MCVYISPLVVAPFNGHPSAVAVRLPIEPERGKTCVRERPLTNSCRHCCRRHRRSFIILHYYVSCFFTDALAALTGPARNVRFGYNDDDDDVKTNDSTDYNITYLLLPTKSASFRRTAFTLQYYYR